MKRNFKKLNAFMLVEALICIALISIFLTYFFIFTNNIYKNDAVSLKKAGINTVAREIIEKSSSSGKLILLNDEKFDIDVKKLLETTRRVDYKLFIKNKNNNKVNEYEFSIDKRQKD